MIELEHGAAAAALAAAAAAAEPRSSVPSDASARRAGSGAAGAAQQGSDGEELTPGSGLLAELATASGGSLPTTVSGAHFVFVVSGPQLLQVARRSSVLGHSFCQPAGWLGWCKSELRSALHLLRARCGQQ